MNTFFYRDKRKFSSETYCEEMYSKLANIVLSNFPFQRDKFNDVFEMFVTATTNAFKQKAGKACKEALDYKRHFYFSQKKELNVSQPFHQW